MKPFRLIAFVLCVLVCSQSSSPAQGMDKELSELAQKLATQIKENGKRKVTVLDFTDLQGGGSELGRYIAEELTVNLVMNRKDFSVLDRANLKSILAEHKLTATGLVDPDTAKKLGQFAGVDALVMGTIVPTSENIQLTAKLITTDTAEIVGAAKATIKTNDTVQQLLSRPAAANEAMEANEPHPVAAAKPFGDLQAKVESMKLLPGDKIYGFAQLTLIISNASASKTYGVALDGYYYHNFNLSNSRGDEFKATEMSGIDMGSDVGDGTFRAVMTDIPPRSAITIVSKSQVPWTGKPGDYRPYRLQTMVIFGVEENGRYPNLKKHNLVLDIK